LIAPALAPAASFHDVIVIGAGAAGLMAALTAGRRGRKVLVLEHQERVGRKIEISGGGRCNFTNLGASPENYLSSNPDFCRSALARFSPWDFVAMVEAHGIGYHEKTLGQQFCDGSSKQIVAMLLAECATAGAEVRCGVQSIEIERTDRFRLHTLQGCMESAVLVIATGGLSFAKLGATDFAYRVARRFGLRVVQPRPGLVPLTFSERDRGWSELSGVALPVVARLGSRAFPEAMLVTHRGLSGPAILQISSFWTEGAEIEIDLLPGVDGGGWLREARAARRDLAALLAEKWPRRWAERWRESEAPPRKLADFKNAEIEQLAARMHRWRFKPAGTEGFPKAEVTLGGIDTRDLSSKTLEARDVPGLFFIGEAVDVTGWLGGYNFQWAWASGHAAGSAV
jgi:hypothetical protein